MSRRLQIAASLIVLALATTQAHAADPDCPLTSQCGAHRVLHLLYVLAIVLGILLTLAIAVGLYSYRKNKDQEPRNQ
jgi:heme/copper-type cytochrome/quinol oxidase subunit 2